ncbi:MAG: MaoC family dehydratase [Halobacteriaceae archaeon]
MERNRYFEEIAVGETRTSQARTITEADVVNYAGVSGDFHPYHVDEEFASDSEFGGRIAHGLLVLSVAAALQAAENEHAFLYGFESMRFVKPTMLGDTIRVASEVTDKTERSDEHGVVTVHFDVRNQDDETVLACDKLLMVERDPGA